MVLAERNSELVRNGRRSRGPSPNGHGTSSAGGGSSTGVGVGGAGVGGAGTPENSSDDDNSIKRNGKSKSKQSEYEEKIRVGRDYQAVCPSLVPENDRKPEIMNDRALLVWSPTKEIPDTKLDDYISVAKEKYGYNGEQALGMLFWHKHDLERAVMDLSNFTPFPDEWTTEDRVLFEQAFQFHGKSFHRIRQMLPDKSIASLVKYYYSWKKTRHRHSVMDRQEKSKANKEGSENGSDNGSNEESDNDDKNPNKSFESANDGDLGESESPAHIDGTHKFHNDQQQHQQHHQQQHQRQLYTPPNDGVYHTSASGRTNTSPAPQLLGDAAGPSCSGSNSSGSCTNCGVHCNVLNASPDGKLCASCHHHWRRTGNNRPTSGPYLGKRSTGERHKRKPPRGMYINHDDIVALASGNENHDKLLQDVEREIASLLSQVQLNKQNMSSLKKKSDNSEDLRPPENTNRISPRWSNEDLSMAIQGIRKYGKDFPTIAELIGTKTEAHVRTFFVSSRRRYNLDQELKKFEADKEAAEIAATAAAAAAAAAASSVSVTAGVDTNATTDTASAKKKEASTEKDAASLPAAAAAAATVAAVTVGEESDNTSSSEATTGITKSVNDEGKLPSTGSNASSTKDDEIVAIDLDADQGDLSPVLEPAAKKIALTVSNRDSPEPVAV